MADHNNKHTAEDDKPKHAFGGLSPEKRALLKKIIMDRALTELKKENEQRETEKRQYLEKKVPHLDFDALRALPHDQLAGKVRSMYDTYVRLCEEQFEWESRIRQQDLEISQLTIRVNNLRGKFVKPILKKVVRPEEARLFNRRKSLQNPAAAKGKTKSGDSSWRSQMRMLRSASSASALHGEQLKQTSAELSATITI